MLSGNVPITPLFYSHFYSPKKNKMQKIIILDFGSQTTQLIGRRVRELNTFCEIMPYNKFPQDDPDVIGVILSGSPYSVYEERAFKLDFSQIRGK